LADDKTTAPTAEQLVSLHWLTHGLAENEIPTALKQAGRIDLYSIWLRNRRAPSPEPTLEERAVRLLRFDELPNLKRRLTKTANSLGSPYRQALWKMAALADKRFWIAVAGLHRGYEIDEGRRQGGASKGRSALTARERIRLAVEALYFPGSMPKVGTRLEAFVTASREGKTSRFRRLSPEIQKELAAADGGKTVEQLVASFGPQRKKGKRRTVSNQAEATFRDICARRGLPREAVFRVMEVIYRIAVPRGRRTFNRLALLRRTSRLQADERWLFWLGLN
jgi:hypothetical protein